jgi:hypothetical protein
MTALWILIAFVVGSGIGYYIGFNQAAHPGKLGGMWSRLTNRTKPTEEPKQ